MDALVVFALGVEHFNRLIIVHQHTLIAYLAAHFAIEWGEIEHQLIESVLLLRHFAVAQNVGGVLGVIITHKRLFAFAHHFPVAIFHSCGVACTCFLLSHFFIEALFVNRESLFATDELGQVEGETVGIKQAEGLCAGQFGLSLCRKLVHIGVEQVDAFFQCAQKRVFLFFDYAADELLLRGQFGVGGTHLMHQGGQQFIEEGLFLI